MQVLTFYIPTMHYMNFLDMDVNEMLCHRLHVVAIWFACTMFFLLPSHFGLVYLRNITNWRNCEYYIR